MAASPSDTGDVNPDYRAYLVRIWRDSEGTPWRASVTHVVGGDLYKFADLSLVWQHIQQQLGVEADGEEVDGS